jgi:hypothetical protein
MTFIVFETAAEGPTPRFDQGSSVDGPVVRAIDNFIPVTMAEGSHPFPFRTRPLSPPAPMVLPG